MSEYYIQAGGVQQGPYAESQLRTMWNSGSVPNDTFYWTEGMAEWAPIVQLMQSPEPQAIQPATQVNSPVEVVDGVYKWFCPHCATKVSVDAVFLEQIWQEYHGKISCPSCSQEIQAPQVDANPITLEMEAEHPGEGHATTQPIEPLSDSQAHVSCPNCWAPVEPEQAVCTGCGYNLQTNTAAPEIPPSASVKELEDLSVQIRKFLTILFFEPFTFAICGPKPGKWTGHALGLVLGSLPITLLYCMFFLRSGLGMVILGFAPIYAFVIGRVYAVIILLRILKIFEAAGVREFGSLRIMYKIHVFFSNLATFRRGGVDWRIPYVSDIT